MKYIKIKYTEKQLWDFVNRANDLEKIDIAMEWLKKQNWSTKNGFDYSLFDELMMTLVYKYRELNKIHH